MREVPGCLGRLPERPEGEHLRLSGQPARPAAVDAPPQQGPYTKKSIVRQEDQLGKNASFTSSPIVTGPYP